MAQLRSTRTTPAGGQVALALAGECDLASRDELTELLLQAVAVAQRVDVDLTELEFIDSTGIHALVIAHHAALARGTEFYVTGAHGRVSTVLNLTGVGELLKPPEPDHD